MVYMCLQGESMRAYEYLLLQVGDDSYSGYLEIPNILGQLKHLYYN